MTHITEPKYDEIQCLSWRIRSTLVYCCCKPGDFLKISEFLASIKYIRHTESCWCYSRMPIDVRIYAVIYCAL